jgi:hypothetical protein
MGMQDPVSGSRQWKAIGGRSDMQENVGVVIGVWASLFEELIPTSFDVASGPTFPHPLSWRGIIFERAVTRFHMIRKVRHEEGMVY